MKKTVKPLPWGMIIFGILAVIAVILSVAEFADTGGSSGGAVALVAVVVIGFGYYLMKYCSQEKIEFDGSSFTVSGEAYSFDEITGVTVKSETILRNVSTLRLRVYIGGEEVANFTKDDSGGKEFIAELKNHGINISIDI